MTDRAMKHNWKRDHHMMNSRRKCLNCGAKQEYECISYDRVSGSRYGWKPNAGRCKPSEKTLVDSPNATAQTPPDSGTKNHGY